MRWIVYELPFTFYYVLCWVCFENESISIYLIDTPKYEEKKKLEEK